MILFVLGPSGAGKTSFGQYLAGSKKWLHLEIDRFPDDGIDAHDLRSEWNSFLAKQPEPLIRELKSRAKDHAGCVLTFPSRLILGPEYITKSEPLVYVVYLYGSAAHCINGFLRREQETGRKLSVDHWITNNHIEYMQMSKPNCEKYRVHVFTPSGSRRKWADVFKEIAKNRAA